MEALLVYQLLLSKVDLVTWVQIRNEAVCILHCANNFGKGVNLTILPPATGK